jgi:uncharacterized protein DUF4381
MQGIDPSTLALRDIHLPSSVSWWPLAPGWWILILVIIITSLSIIFLIRRHRRHRASAVYLAKQELERIKENYKSQQDKLILVKELSELIRRVSISVFKRSDAASLTGQQWLEFLDQENIEKPFSQGTGRILIEAPYQASPEFDSDELIALITSWLDIVSNNKGHKK